MGWAPVTVATVPFPLPLPPAAVAAAIIGAPWPGPAVPLPAQYVPPPNEQPALTAGEGGACYTEQHTPGDPPSQKNATLGGGGRSQCAAGMGTPLVRSQTSVHQPQFAGVPHAAPAGIPWTLTNLQALAAQHSSPTRVLTAPHPIMTAPHSPSYLSRSPLSLSLSGRSALGRSRSLQPHTMH